MNRWCCYSRKRIRSSVSAASSSSSHPAVPRCLVRVPMNRQDIADHLGLTIESVSPTITKLASRNIVICEGRHELRIVNLARLIQLSGDANDFSEDP